MGILWTMHAHDTHLYGMQGYYYMYTGILFSCVNNQGQGINVHKYKSDACMQVWKYR